MPCSDAGAVFVEVPIEHVVETLDGPMAAIGGEHAFGIGLFGRPAGDADHRFERGFSVFFANYLALDHEDLSHMREVEVVVERRAAPDAAGFNPALIGRRHVPINKTEEKT